MRLQRTLSMIDSAGLYARATGVVRGSDLTAAFRYQSTTPPLLFADQG